ncbi:nucleoside hydrolase [Haladaptatus pallidirubidus]|uniref:Nucleoside hydrolase n=1 Tax=Haladaptatus pallidirubidus TaxID=1008152 RepID=A0AAV3US70_9EURY|nr:nucleoside hydrolase [Haladaptatus pallidirubidus]
MNEDTRRVIIDTDTAGDDTQALLLAATANDIEVEGVTICTGNVEFEYMVENAKYTLDMVGTAEDVTVYEGARTPLVKTHEYADYVHGEGGLGGNLFPDTGIPSGDRHGADYIVEMARKNPGEITLACIAPLTNVALALQKEPNLNELLDEVWVMGGNVNCLGNVTPAAEFNFWVDPDAAKRAIRELDIVLFDWGVTVRDTVFDAELLAEIDDGPDTELASFFTEITAPVREFNKESQGRDMTTQPDAGLMAALIEPDLIESAVTYHVDVDEREGLTRGYTLVDEDDITDGEARTTVIESFDTAAFHQMFKDMLFESSPTASL